MPGPHHWVVVLGSVVKSECLGGETQVLVLGKPVDDGYVEQRLRVSELEGVNGGPSVQQTLNHGWSMRLYEFKIIFRVLY